MQGCWSPTVLRLRPQQDEILKSEKGNLQDFGFKIEPFGERTYLVRLIPAVLGRRQLLEALREILDSPRDKTTTSRIISSSRWPVTARCEPARS